MATAILHLSAAFGAEMVAEGVETEAEARALIDLGYLAAQGYLFARPMPIDDLATILRAGGGQGGSTAAAGSMPVGHFTQGLRVETRKSRPALES